MTSGRRPVPLRALTGRTRPYFHYRPRQVIGRATILVICTGNMCRSPIAERLLRAMLADAFGKRAGAVRVISAGTHARPDGEMAPNAEQVLGELGADGSGFRATRLTPELVEEADLVLCATREHRSAAVTLAPRALRRTFTLREFGRLATYVDAELLAYLPLAAQIGTAAAEAARLRGYHPPDKPSHDDLGDPVGRPVAAFRTCATMIEANLQTLLDLLAEARELTEQTGAPQAGTAQAGTAQAGAEPGSTRRAGAASPARVEPTPATAPRSTTSRR